MSLTVIGINYNNIPLAVREKISITNKKYYEMYNYLNSIHCISGALILSTCNRLEVYMVTGDPLGARESVVNFISEYSLIDKKYLYEVFYLFNDINAFKHLLKVISGLDSALIGESQITGQIKNAFKYFDERDHDVLLKKVFRNAILLSGMLRKNINIASGKISIASVAIDFVKSRMVSLKGKKILILGVGNLSRLVIKYLKNNDPEVVFISSRNLDKTKIIAENTGVKAVDFKQLDAYIKDADVIISATSSPHFIINKEKMISVDHKKLMIIDLAVPRDIDPAIRGMKGIDLYYIEDLYVIIERNIENKKIRVEKAMKIIAERAECLWKTILESVQEEALLQ